MTPVEAKDIRETIVAELLRGSTISDIEIIAGGWEAIMLANARFDNPTEGNISDLDFRVLSEVARSKYDETQLYLVTSERYDGFEAAAGCNVPGVLEFSNSPDGYDKIKHVPGYFEFYIFGDSLKWLLFATSEWSLVCGEKKFVVALKEKYGGSFEYLRKLDRELGIPNVRLELSKAQRDWFAFLHRVVGTDVDRFHE